MITLEVPSTETLATNEVPITRTFSTRGCDPFDEISWDRRTTSITDDSGKTIFKQENVEVPSTWSDLAVKVVVSKYFYGEQGTKERETSVRQLIHRVCRTITEWGLADGYFNKDDAEVFYTELAWLCLNQYGAFNSPVWFNVGLHHEYGIGAASGKGNWFYERETGKANRSATQYEYPQCSACFIQSVDDNMESIMRLAYSEAMLFKFGSGTGTDLSSIRSCREKLSGGGKPSGPLSFLKVYDQVANVVKSGGKTRRAAKMNTLNDWHGDIEEFINCKQNEERKAWSLIEAGYDGSFNGEAYGSVMYQNENLSVRVSDEFMQAALDGKEWWTRTVTTGKPLEKKDAKSLLRKIAEGTHVCGDPGLQFDGSIQRWHTCKETAQINSTNPCSEYVFLDNTACNLASLNLMKFKRQDGVFDVERFKAAVRIFILAQEILVDNASYPTEDIAVNSHIFRTLGLGYANLGSLIMSYGLPYDSDMARGIAGAITALMTGEAYAQSARIARQMGAFSGYEDASCAHVRHQNKRSNKESMLDVIHQHNAACEALPKSVPGYLRTAALESWEYACDLGKIHGYRNAQVTVLAPTGTIGFLMDCDTTGIEPDIALVKYKLLAGGGNLKIVNRTVTEALREMFYSPGEIASILTHIETHDTVEPIRDTTGKIQVESPLKAVHLSIFDCAFKPAKGKRSIHWMAHLKMMAAAQPFISGAISKTVNLPSEATVEDIQHAYVEAWKMGLKCVAIYRDGSKRSQPLNTRKSVDPVKVSQAEIAEILAKDGLQIVSKEFVAAAMSALEVAKTSGQPVRHRLPETRPAVTHKFDVAGHEGYMTVGLFDDGSPGELFITMAKEGSTVGGLMDSIGTLTSIALQYGVGIDTLVRKFSHQRFEPAGITKNAQIRIASSIIDYVFRWMELEFSKKVESNGSAEAVSVTPYVAGPEAPVHTIGESPISRSVAHFQQDAPTCPNCGHVAVRNGACFKCLNCGESLGCS